MSIPSIKHFSPKIIAHRGASGITGEDNTLKSFQTAWMMHCDIVEFDIRQTKCGEIVCFHDQKLNTLPVSDLTFLELKKMAACDVPLLEETIIECKGRIILDVEIKEEGFEKEALKILQQHLDKDAYIIKSFIPEVVKKISELDDSVRCGLLLDECEDGEEKNYIAESSQAIKMCQPDFLAVYYKLLEPWFLNHKDFQLPLLAWTVNDPVDMQKIIDLNIEGIITDRPDYLDELIKRPKKNLDKEFINTIVPDCDSSSLISLLEHSRIGKSEIDTKHVRIGRGVFDEATSWVNCIAGNSAEVTIISDDNTATYANQLSVTFDKKPNHIVLSPLDGWEKLTPHMSFCEDIAEQTKNADILISCGSGTVNDLTKYAAHINNKPYISCATAASMNGYTSSIAALLIDGLKSTIVCAPPVVLLADTNIIAQASKAMAISGYSDLLSKPMSTADWLMSNILFDVPYDNLPSIVVSNALQNSIEVAEQIKSHNLNALEDLMKCLVLSGFSMTLAGSSSPASGGEHLISHYLDMKSYAAGKIPALHGQQVAIGTLITSLLYEEIVQLKPEDLNYKLKSEKRLKEIHQELWEQIKPEAIKQIFNEEESKTRLTVIREKWPLFCETIKNEVWSYSKIKECLIKGGAEINPDKLGINRKWLETALMHASDIRNRYTILHLAAEIGLLDKIKPKILEILYS